MDDPSIVRLYGSIKSTLLDILNTYIYLKSYTEFDTNPLYGQMTIYNARKLKNRNQQTFICIPVDTSVETTRIFTPSYSPPDQPKISTLSVAISDLAWIKFNYPFPPISIGIEREYDPNYPMEPLAGGKKYSVMRNSIQFQGYRLMDMPPPPILKAFAHGPPVDMSPHVKERFPEWTRPDTLKVWLKSVMDKWLADIIVLRDRLLREVCNPDNTFNMNVRHLRDVPIIQYELYQDVLGYINRVYTGKFTLVGGLRSITKSAVKSKEMVIDRKTLRRGRKQRGGATGMPLAYFQDGAQMRGTYAEPTGVGLADSNGSMARVGISQTGGRYQNGKRRDYQNGGFAPSIMGQLVVNGAYLTPVASYMGYKMLKGNKGRRSAHPSGSRTGRAHRGPRSTHKKRR